MKRLVGLYLFACATLVLLTNAAFAQPNTHDLQRKILQTVKIDKNSLALKVGYELQQYYDRTFFNDPAHTSGWFRVDDFLKWVEENQDNLGDRKVYVNKFYWKSSFDDSKRTSPLEGEKFSLEDLYYSGQKYLFWTYLGTLYIIDKYKLDPHWSRFTLLDKLPNNTATFGDAENTGSPSAISLAKRYHQAAIPILINIGIHEGTHLLPRLTRESTYPLGELATFYSQYNYGLPVKPQDMIDFSLGTRDIRRTHKYRPDFDSRLPYEYHYFIVGIFLNKFLRPKDILEFNKTSKKNDTDPSFWEVTMSWVPLYKEKWFHGTETIDFNLEEAAETLQPFGFAGQEAATCENKNPGYTFYVGKVERIKTQYARLPDKWLTLTLTCNGELGQLNLYYWPLSGTEFLQEAFPGFGRSKVETLEFLFNAHSKKIAKFYNKIIEHLPKDLVEKLNAKWERRVGWERINDKKKQQLLKITQGYEQAFADAILLSLDEIDAPPPPAIPEGYL